MGSRGHGPPAYGSRSTQAPGMMRHASYPSSQNIEPHHPERGEIKLVTQSTELQRLAGDNQRLATTHVALRQDLVATQQDIQKLRAHIGSIQTESDIQIRVLLDKMAKMDVRLRGGEDVKKGVQRAHSEARALVVARQELIGQIEKATQELEKVRSEVEKVPKMHVELDGLRQEHQKLRKTFEHEKNLNMEKVAQMELMEKELVGMAREVERLRAELSNNKKKAEDPALYLASYMNSYPPPPHMHVSGGGYVDGYGRHHHVNMGGSGEGMIPYGGAGYSGPVVPGSNLPWGGPPMVPYGGGHPGPTAPGGNPQWGRGPPYDNSYPRV